MDCILYQLKCCFGPFGCSFLCLGPIRQSITTRSMYSLNLIIVSILCVFIHERNIFESAILKLGPKLNLTCIYIQANVSCSRFLGFKAIYRIAYSFAAFHLILAFFCIGISSSQVWRAKFHNGMKRKESTINSGCEGHCINNRGAGKSVCVSADCHNMTEDDVSKWITALMIFWFFKFIIISLFWAAFFYVPTIENHIKIATIIGICAALIFIILQDVSLIDCAYELNEYLREKGSKNCCYGMLLYLTIVALYLLTLGGYIFLYFIYAIPRPCVKNRAIILVNAIGSLIIILFSVCIAIHRKNKLYIPGGITCIFVAYITWTAINSSPFEMVPFTYKPRTPAETRSIIPYDSRNKIYFCKSDVKALKSTFGKELDKLVGMFIMLATAVYCCIKSTVEYHRYGIKTKRSKQFSTSSEIEMKEIKSKNRMSANFSDSKRGDRNDELIHKCLSLPSIKIISSNNKKPMCVGDNEQGIVSVEKKKFKKSKKVSSRSIDQEGDRVQEQDDLSRYPIDSYLIHDDFFGVKYSYSWMHFNFALAHLFVMVQLTNWYSPQTAHILNFDKSWQSMWMKIATGWIALGLYSWTLIFPGFCVGRRLYEYPFDSMNRYRKKVQSKKSGEKRKK